MLLFSFLFTLKKGSSLYVSGKENKGKSRGIVLSMYRKIMFDTALSRVYKLGCASPLYAVSLYFLGVYKDKTIICLNGE